MSCFVCGKPRAEFHASSIFMPGELPESRAYCEACFVATFDGLPQMDELRAHARKLREKELDDKIARDMEKLRAHFRPKLEELIAQNPRSPSSPTNLSTPLSAAPCTTPRPSRAVAAATPTPPNSSAPRKSKPAAPGVKPR